MQKHTRRRGPVSKQPLTDVRVWSRRSETPCARVRCLVTTVSESKTVGGVRGSGERPAAVFFSFFAVLFGQRPGTPPSGQPITRWFYSLLSLITALTVSRCSRPFFQDRSNDNLIFPVFSGLIGYGNFDIVFIVFGRFLGFICFSGLCLFL